MEHRGDRKGANQKRMQDFSLQDLLCKETLHNSLRHSTNVSVNSREGLKALLDPNLQNLPSPTPAPVTNAALHWENCLQILVDDFCAKKGELLKLNKARRTQIEIALQKYNDLPPPITLEQLHGARPGSKEHEAFIHFAFETAAFQLLQILLLKRWVDLGMMPADLLQNNEHTLNWKITSFLKKHYPKRLLQKNEWRFLKQNIYSWHSPSKEAWQRVRLHIAPLSLENAAEDFPIQILFHACGPHRMAALGISKHMPLAEFSWKLLLKFLSFEEQKGVCTVSPILIAGLAQGQSLVAFEKTSHRRDLQRVLGFTENDFEHFLTEILLLWANPQNIPHPQLLPISLLNKTNTTGEHDFLQEKNALLQQPISLAYFHGPNGNGNNFEQALQCIDLLEEHGLLLLCSSQFWTTEDSPEAANFREAVLKKCSIRLILDLRQCTYGARNTNPGELPKGYYVLEKCNTREWRDSNRPLVFKAKGTIANAEALQSLWADMEKHLDGSLLPGEIFTSTSNGTLKLEAMAAAATQQQLKASPWNTLTETCYYEISGELKRLPLRIYGCGNILRAKNVENVSTFKGGIALQEVPGKALITENLQSKATQYLFIPDRTIAESPVYFSAMINSSPIQFWYRLEHEQDLKKRGRSQERQTEQLLKFMPVARIFTNSLHLPTENRSRLGFASWEIALSSADRLLSKRDHLSSNEQLELHDLVVDLENAISRHISTALDFVKHLFPELTMERWCLPTNLPEISALHAMNLLKHLDQLPLAHHPAIQVVHLRAVHDFRLSQAKINTVYGPISEMLLFSGNDPVIRLQGPSLFIRYLYSELQKKIGRSWLETVQKTFLPADAALVNAQIQEFLKITSSEIQNARQMIECQNTIFSVLFGVAKSVNDTGRLNTIRRHLNPEENKIILPVQKSEVLSAIPGNSVSPRVILQ